MNAEKLVSYKSKKNHDIGKADGLMIIAAPLRSAVAEALRGRAVPT
jgi:hypothetical protein